MLLITELQYIQCKNWQDCKDKQPSYNHVGDFFFPKKKNLFLAALGLGCGTQALPLGAWAFQLTCLVALKHVGSQCPNQGWNLCSLQWKVDLFFQCGSFIEFVTILFLLYVLFFFAMRHVGFQLSAQGSNHTPSIGRQSANPWTTREVLES